ncbi:FhaA domain-containing protein [Nocardioides convexus]|uniref:FhaA domain-containing protein n=1 Tax=Nocardioides convexus TaxID=2712224 RepID=UPI0024188C2A|nr:FhaA domain-containing protein [Nocardioides convexus]
MGGLQRFEQRLEQAISGVFARTFRSAVQPVEIAAALQRETRQQGAGALAAAAAGAEQASWWSLSGGDLERLTPYDSALESETHRAG